MKKISFGVLLLGLVVPQVWAVPCASGTLASYAALGAGGCTIGDKLFSNFDLVNTIGTGGLSALTAADINLIPITGPNIGLAFGALWSAGTGQILDTAISFVVSVIGGSPQLIEDASTVQSSSGFTGTGVASVTEGICGPAPCSSITSTTTINTAGTIQLSNRVAFTPTGSVQAVKDIGVSGGTNGTASISLVEDTFSQTPGPVPEPASIALFGTMLLGLGCFSNRMMHFKRN